MKTDVSCPRAVGWLGIVMCVASLAAPPATADDCNTVLLTERVDQVGASLDSPTISIPAAAARLSFRNRFRFHDDNGSCLDAGVLEIQIEAGPFTDIAVAGGRFVTGGYTGSVASVHGHSLADRAAWCGTSPGWPAYLTTVVELPVTAAGQTIRLRWRRGSDLSRQEIGQEIDSVEILGACADADSRLAGCDDNNPCTIDTGLPPNCMHFPADNTPCDDGNFCTTVDRCFGGHCMGTGQANCDDGNPCTSDGCFGGACNHANVAGSCNDGNACTTGDACADGVCSGNPVTAPAETQNVMVDADKATYSWSAAAGATRYDVLRGVAGALPVGPGAGDETCFNDLATTSLTDAEIPPPETGFWYVSRGQNACANGTYGSQSNGTPRLSTTCP